MTHVDGMLGRWLGGELDEAQAAAVQAHLDRCDACRAEAAALRGVWLDLAAAAPAPAAGSVWPAVQARTGGPGRTWFLAGRPVARTALAAAALAAGLLAGVLLPGGGTATAADTTIWVASSRALDDGVAALDLWLDTDEAAPEVPR